MKPPRFVMVLANCVTAPPFMPYPDVSFPSPEDICRRPEWVEGFSAKLPTPLAKLAALVRFSGVTNWPARLSIGCIRFRLSNRPIPRRFFPRVRFATGLPTQELCRLLKFVRDCCLTVGIFLSGPKRLRLRRLSGTVGPLITLSLFAGDGPAAT